MADGSQEDRTGKPVLLPEIDRTSEEEERGTPVSGSLTGEVGKSDELP